MNIQLSNLIPIASLGDDLLLLVKDTDFGTSGCRCCQIHLDTQKFYFYENIEQVLKFTPFVEVPESQWEFFRVKIYQKVSVEMIVEILNWFDNEKTIENDNRTDFQNEEKILAFIEDHSGSIIEIISVESIDVYVFLRDQFKTCNINKNHLFQFVYRSFYRLDNAGLTLDFKNKYFELLENNKNTSSFEIKEVLKELYKFPNTKGSKNNSKGNKETFQFSFATKMWNTIDCNIAIYDSKVADVFGFKRPYSKNFDNKLNKYLNDLNSIQFFYEKIISKKLLPKTVEQFNHEFGDRNLSEIKKLDFIFWSAGKIKSKQYS